MSAMEDMPNFWTRGMGEGMSKADYVMLALHVNGMCIRELLSKQPAARHIDSRDLEIWLSDMYDAIRLLAVANLDSVVPGSDPPLVVKRPSGAIPPNRAEAIENNRGNG